MTTIEAPTADSDHHGTAAPPRTALLVANGDLRESANVECWPAQAALGAAAAATRSTSLGWSLQRAHPVDPATGHGFIGSQAHGREVFADLDPDAPIVVAEAVWQYSQQVLIGLLRHRGPILILANWSGEWPGLVGALNLRASLTKAGVASTLIWSEDFTDDLSRSRLAEWLDRGTITYDLSHVTAARRRSRLPAAERALGERLAADLRRRPAIMGIFDEGCMGMYNAIIPDEMLAAAGVFKERLSQAAALLRHDPGAGGRGRGGALVPRPGRHALPDRAPTSHRAHRAPDPRAVPDVRRRACASPTSSAAT